jgi:AcrR family transcriptional regulator
MNPSSLKVAKGNRFERRKQRTRDDLVVAATRVLANKGLQATKITDIAAAADVGVGTFYLHFETKDALYDALVEDAAQRLKAAVDAAREGIDDPVAETRAATAAMCRFARDNREVFKLVFGPAVSHHDVTSSRPSAVASNAASSVPYHRRSPRRRWSACRRSSSRGGASTKRYRSSG